MQIYVADSFTTEIFSGNQAGVVILGNNENYPADFFMQSLAAELKHSETAFVKKLNDKEFHIKYFTPMGEVDLCGHATIAAFFVLRGENGLETGKYTAITLAGKLGIQVKEDSIWMEMASPKEFKVFDENESEELYQAYGLTLKNKPNGMMPKIISTGLRDILLPVNSRETLNLAVQDAKKVVAISKKYDVVGVHMFCISGEEKTTAYCRNFAPLFGIDEESATGTANGALAYYLEQYGIIKKAEENTFIQGEAMGKRSVIKSKIVGNCVTIGGSAVVSMKCILKGYKDE